MRNRIGALAASLSRLTHGTTGALPTAVPAVAPASSLSGQGTGAPSGRRTVSLLLLLTLVIFAVLATAAQAAPKGTVDVFEAQNPAGLAVNQTSGDVYAVDSGNEQVNRFDADGNLLGTFGAPGAGAEGEFFFAGSPAGVAVAPDGSVYVADTNNHRVQKFDTDGTFVFTFGLDVETANPGYAVCTSGCQPGTADSSDGALSGPLGVAVDPGNGDVYVADTNNSRVQRYSSGGAYLGQFASPTPAAIAADDGGVVYTLEQGAAQLRRSEGGADAVEFPFFSNEFTFNHIAPIYSLAVDPATHHVFAAKWIYNEVSGDFDSGAEVLEADTTGEIVDRHKFRRDLGDTYGVAVRSSTGRIYVSQTPESRVFILDAPVSTATVEATTDVTSRTATLNGMVNPGGDLPVGYHFEVSADGVTWTSFPQTDVDVGPGTSNIPVSQPATGLEPGANYQVRLVVSNEFGSTVTSTGNAGDFTTDPEPPDVTTLPATQLRATAAQLLGEINANNTPTTYYFEYGETTAYGNRVPVGPDASAGSGGDAILVAEQVSGLNPDTEYHYRLVASNTAGTTEGNDQTFRTRAATAAPSGRAYELVSPADKPAGVGVGSWYAGPDAVGPVGFGAHDGDRFASSGQTGSTLADGSFAYTNDIALGERTPFGWVNKPGISRSAHGPQPTTDITTAVASPSLSLFALESAQVLKLFPEMAEWPDNATALLLRKWAEPQFEVFGPTDPSQDVTTPPDSNLPVSKGDRAFAADGSAVVASDPGTRGLAGPGDPTSAQFDDRADGGGSVYLDEIGGPFTDTFPGDDGVRELVNVCTGTGADRTELPSGPCPDPLPGRDARLTSEGGAALFPGGSANLSRSVISANGSRVFFMSPDPALSGFGPSQLFVRQRGTDGQVKVRWIARTEVAGQAASLRAPVYFEGASSDGDKVFFRTTSPLTDDDPNDGGSITTGSPDPQSSDLYMYDLPDGPDGDPSTPDADPDGGDLTRISAGPTGTSDCNAGQNDNPGQGPLRFTSDDASRAYFTCGAPLAGAAAAEGAASQPGGDASTTELTNLYAYDANKPPSERWRFIGRLDRGSNLENCATQSKGIGSTISTLLQSQPSGSFSISGENNCVRGSTDGSLVTFFTPSRLTADDAADETADVYGYDAGRGELTRISAAQGGPGGQYDCVPGQPGFGQCNGDLGIGRGLTALEMLNVATNSDGEQLAFFQSRRRLVAEDTDDAYDVYQWRAGELSLVTPGGSDPDGQFYVGNDRTGTNVYIATRDQLSWQDKDRVLDIYSVRVGGGIPEPPTPVLCAALADACQSPGAGAPTPTSGATTRPTGGNAKPAPRASLRVSKLTRSQLAPLARGRKVRLKVTVTARGKVSVRGRGRVGRKTRTVLSGSANAAKAGTVRVTLRLSKSARRQLARSGRLRVTLSVKSSGVSKAATSSFTLTKAKKSARRATAPAMRNGR